MTPRRRVVVLAVGGAALLLLALVYVLATPPTHLSAYRTGPDHLGEFRATAEDYGFGTASIGTSPHVASSLSRPDRALVLTAGVERPYRPGEIDALVAFVEDGGSLVVADDFGFANQLADRFGVNFDKLRLFDENYRGDPGLVAVRATLGERDYDLVLNVPTALSVRNPDATVLAFSSEKSFLDANANGMKDDQDVQGAFVVAVLVPKGTGRAVFLGDPGPFTDAMLGEGDNRAFLLNLATELLPREGGTIVFDESRHTRNVVAAGAGAVLETLVVATSERGFRWLVLASLAAAVLTWLRLRRREEAFGHHEGALDQPTQVASSPARERLRALARARLVAVHGVAPDADPAVFREVARDEVVGRLAAGEEGLNIAESLDDVLRRLDDYGRSAPGKRDAP